jgi:hypothetical protein
MVTTQHDEDVPRLAEIARTLTDFRAEFRSVTQDMVRKDVYSAHMTAVQLQIQTLEKENRRVAEDMDREIQRISSEINNDRSDRRSIRNIALSAVLSSILAIIVIGVEIILK